VETLTTPPLVEWGVAARALAGETASGDEYVIQPFPNGVLAGVVDGLGHGAAAAAAARPAIVTLQAYAHEPLIPLLQRCHAALLHTRGVAMTLASFDALNGTLTWLGVGNVEGLLLRADKGAGPSHETILLRGGVIGYQLPPLHATTVPIAPDDLLILATDGIRSDFALQLNMTPPAQSIADHILAHSGRRTDDALVLVVRYLGLRG
jgi:serine phosphatase RsbU (regulator of sigma subunit)